MNGALAGLLFDEHFVARMQILQGSSAYRRAFDENPTPFTTFEEVTRFSGEKKI